MAAALATPVQPAARAIAPRSSPSSSSTSSPPTPELRRFSVDEYHRMIRDGYFTHDERFELLDGLIVRKMPKDSIHEAVLHRANRVLTAMLPTGWHVRMQSPVTLSTSEPEPDLSIAPGTELDWSTRHPGPAEVPLVVEVANSTLSDDRNWKAAVYSRDRLLIYLILNILDWRVEAYSDPSGEDPAPAYRRREDFVSGQSISLSIAGAVVTVAVDDLMPPQIRPSFQ
jgi:hypothetical protein